MLKFKVASSIKYLVCSVKIHCILIIESLGGIP